MNTKADKSKNVPANVANCDEEIQTPSRITELHVQDRETSTVAGAPRAWRKRSQLENAFELERLGPKDSGAALQRLSAGMSFTQLWDTAQSAGRDSTAALDGAGGGGGTPLPERVRGAIQRLVQVELHLGRNDRTIIRSVCAYGFTPVEAMARCGLSNETRVTARLCEALDALVDAFERTAKSKRVQ